MDLLLPLLANVANAVCCALKKFLNSSVEMLTLKLVGMFFLLILIIISFAICVVIITIIVVISVLTE